MSPLREFINKRSRHPLACRQVPLSSKRGIRDVVGLLLNPEKTMSPSSIRNLQPLKNSGRQDLRRLLKSDIQIVTQAHEIQMSHSAVGLELRNPGEHRFQII